MEYDPNLYIYKTPSATNYQESLWKWVWKEYRNKRNKAIVSPRNIKNCTHRVSLT